jgi:exopolysaccharide biosynthesis WecB/TagA/CpsF family protein
MDTVELAGININNLTYDDLNSIIEASVIKENQTLITYANANSINCVYSDSKTKQLLTSFDVIHPDGFGIYAASKFLYGSNGFKERFTGSDYYPLFISKAIKCKWKVFFFGHDKQTLHKIYRNCPGLNICGTNPGYNYTDDDVIDKINSAKPDVLIVGLSFPIQEEWILRNNNKIHTKAVLCVGDGIKVFAGTKKRGPEFLRYLGLEWLIRFLSNPIKYFKRYIIGNPLFLYRIILLKIRKFRG